MRFRRSLTFRTWQLAGSGLVVLWLSLWLVRAEEVSKPQRIIAGYLREFPGYVEWPNRSLNTTNQIWRVGVAGPDPFGEILENALQKRESSRRTYEIWHAMALKDLPPCEMIFLAFKDRDDTQKALRELGERPVLTIAEQEKFLEAGGIIELRIRKTVQIAINLDRARALRLKISPKLLELSTEVLENGERHKWKH